MLAHPVAFSKMADDNDLVSVKVRTSLVNHEVHIKEICFDFFLSFGSYILVYFILLMIKRLSIFFCNVVHFLITHNL